MCRSSSLALFSALLFVLLIGVPPAQAQEQDELADVLRTLGREYADNYTQPVTDALGANMNAGLFRTAEVAGGGLVPGIDIYVGAAAMGALTAGSATSFGLSEDQIEVTMDGGNTQTITIDYPDRDVPTVFGEENFSGQADILDENGQKIGEIGLPSGLLDTRIAPLVVPQVGLGTVFGTDAQVRFLPDTDFGDYGSVSMVGVSVRHSLSQYVPLAPVNVAVQGTWQSLSLSGSEGSNNPSEIVDASGWALNAQVSKSVPVLPITLYGGLQYERFGTDVEYVFETQAGTSSISFDQDASNRVRALGGVAFTLAVLRVNVDYALSANNTVSAGVGLTL